MIIKLKTIEELKRDFLVSLRNNCGDKITKVTPNSVLNGIAYGMAKIVQKINRDAALIEAKLFPEFANATVLDDVAKREGMPSREITSKSSVVLLFEAPSTTVYSITTQVKSASGVIFETLSELTIDVNGFGYVLAESTLSGVSQDVSFGSVTIMVTSPPAGHISVINPVRSVGGKDAEDDFEYKKRILNSFNIMSKNTSAFYEALVRKFDSSVLRVHSRSLNRIDNRFELILVKNSGGNYSGGDLTTVRDNIKNYIPYSDFGNNTINVVNITWTYIDLYVPVKLDGSVALADVLKQMQMDVVNYLNISSWTFGKKVNWDVLLQICNNVTGVVEVDDESFTPRKDIQVAESSLPRLRDFTIKDVVTTTTIGQVNTPVWGLYTKQNTYNVNYIV